MDKMYNIVESSVDDANNAGEETDRFIPDERQGDEGPGGVGACI
jgi:hypothetical protein